MYQSLFETPVWITKVDPARTNLVSSDFKESFLSNSLSSFDGKNEIDAEGTEYLLNKISHCLQDLNIKSIGLIQIWRNIYNGHCQERHMHVKSHFSFTIYEKLEKPQTVFYHPAHDMIYSLGLENYIKPVITPKVVQGDMILFPSYLEHMVKPSKGSMTISGNIGIL
tara:strand:+ start:788 stop:1288 length:501 start_codon:yes stop_codon:yes gene_type:complete